MVFMFDPSTNSFGNNSTLTKELHTVKRKNPAASLMLSHFNSHKCDHFIRGLFKDAITSSDNSVSNGGLINE
jgi:hypothetical protein